MISAPGGAPAEEVDEEPTYPVAVVSSIVFLDTNGNGAQEEGEVGVEGALVTVELPPEGDFPGHAETVLTDADGVYVFEIHGIPEPLRIVGQVRVELSRGGARGRESTTPNPRDTLPLGQGVHDFSCVFGLQAPQVEARFCAEDVTVLSEECVDVPVLLSSTHPVEGLVTALRHDEGLELKAISVAGTATELNGADFEHFEVLSEGGTAGIIMDMQEPYDGNVIPPGENLSAVVYRYCAPAVPTGSDRRMFRLRFVDGELGDPAKENLVVVGGLSFAPTFCEIAITVLPEPPQGGVCFYVGGPELGPDDLPPEIEGSAGETRELSFYYTSEEDYQPGGPQFDQIQGLEMALEHDCALTVNEAFDVTADTVTSAVNAGYISFHADNDPDDGDGCEMVLAILVDAEPPFDGATLPPTPKPLKLGTVQVEISQEAACGACFSVEFRDGVNGLGKIPIRNLYAAENQSFLPCLKGTRVCIPGEPLFRRGDCKFDAKVNVTDAVGVLRYLFPLWSGQYVPPCLDACDADDNGRVELPDAVYILRWLFVRGPIPPPPGPITPGLDPTPDADGVDLGCNVRECR